MKVASRAQSSDQLALLLAQHRERERDVFDDGHNHTPMVLIALWRLGAQARQLEEYVAGLRRDRPVAAPSEESREPIRAGDWTRHLGAQSAWPRYRSYFASAVERSGTEAVLRGHVGVLMGGVAAHAFHPLIRLAYGVELDDAGEIASGLAYWASTYMPGPALPAERAALTPAAFLRRLQHSAAAEPTAAPGANIDQRIRAVYRRPAFSAQLVPMALDAADPLAEVAGVVADAFTARHDFTLLHAVTSCHALRTIMPFVADPTRAVTQYWYAVCAASLTLPRASGLAPVALPDAATDWAEIRPRAIASRIEHTIKLAWTCESEWRAYGSDLYRQLALREIERPAPFC